jgi:hypothetical protein
MSKKKPGKAEARLRHPGHLLSAESILTFIESAVFQKAWKKCDLGDDDLMELQLLIMAHPKNASPWQAVLPCGKWWSTNTSFLREGRYHEGQQQNRQDRSEYIR